jgi:hypothetical protein
LPVASLSIAAPQKNVDFQLNHEKLRPRCAPREAEGVRRGPKAIAVPAEGGKWSSGWE